MILTAASLARVFRPSLGRASAGFVDVPIS